MGQDRFSNEEIAWLAGIIDGEGSWEFKDRDRYRYCRIIIGNTSLEIIERCKIIIEKIINHDIKVYNWKRKKKCKPFFSIELARREDVYAIIKICYPYLVNKKEKIDMLLKELENYFLPIINIIKEVNK